MPRLAHRRRAAGVRPSAPAAPVLSSAVAPPVEKTSRGRVTPERTEAISNAGPLHRVLEGTLIDTVLTNRLDGSAAAPVNCLVTNAIYSHSRQHVLIPAGARVLGETKPVQAFGETRLAVVFHRLLMPDGRTYRLDEFIGLNQIGDAGLQDRVNQHYLATFGAAAAVGLISGLAQFLGNVGLGAGDGDRTVIIAGGVGDATSQATVQVMNRFLNRLPTVTIREGHRVKVYLTSDLELPAYDAHGQRSGALKEDAMRRWIGISLLRVDRRDHPLGRRSSSSIREISSRRFLSPNEPGSTISSCAANTKRLFGWRPVSATWTSSECRRSPSPGTIPAVGNMAARGFEGLNSGDPSGAAYAADHVAARASKRGNRPPDGRARPCL